MPRSFRWFPLAALFATASSFAQDVTVVLPAPPVPTVHVHVPAPVILVPGPVVVEHHTVIEEHDSDHGRGNRGKHKGQRK